MNQDNKCCKQVSGEGTWGSFHMHGCRRPVKIERDGKLYCAIHDPEAVTKRRKLADERWTAKNRIARLKWYAYELLALLVESQTSTGDDWRERRDKLIEKINT